MNVENLEFNHVGYDKEKGLFYDEYTGEVFEANEKGARRLLEMKKIEDESRKAKEESFKKEFGIDQEREKYEWDWGAGVHFVKTYRVLNQKVSREVDVNKDEAMLLYIFDSRIEFRTNRITLHNGDSITNDDIRELADMGRDKVAKTLKSLEDKWFIRRVGSTSAREIYYNPYLKSAGNVMCKETLKLFENYPWTGRVSLAKLPLDG